MLSSRFSSKKITKHDPVILKHLINKRSINHYAKVLMKESQLFS